MNWEQFVASIVSSLAWPAVVAFLIFILRQELPSLIRRLRAANIGGNSVEFNEALEKASEESTLLIGDGTREKVSGEFDQRALDIAQKFPEAAVINAYKEVESILLELRNVLALSPRTNLRGVVRRLIELDLMDSETEPFFLSFQQAHKAAAHSGGEPITSGGAVEYLRQAQLLSSIFGDALKQLKSGHRT